MTLYRPEYQKAYIDSATTTQVYTGKCVLHSIVVGTTAAGAIGIIDGTAGTTVNVGELKASIVEGTYTFDASMAAGIRIVTGGASKITVTYTSY